MRFIGYCASLSHVGPSLAVYDIAYQSIFYNNQRVVQFRVLNEVMKLDQAWHSGPRIDLILIELFPVLKYDVSQVHSP